MRVKLYQTNSNAPEAIKGSAFADQDKEEGLRWMARTSLDYKKKVADRMDELIRGDGPDNIVARLALIGWNHLLDVNRERKQEQQNGG